MAHLIKNPPAMQETWVPPLGWEDPLEKGIATHFSNFAWKIPKTEEHERLQFKVSQKSDITAHTNSHAIFHHSE